MGASLPNSARDFVPAEEGWVQGLSPEGIVIWTNPSTQQELQEHQFMVNDQSELRHEREIFKLRYSNPYLVSSISLIDSSHNEVCATMHKVTVYLERIPLRLSDVKEIPYPDVMHVYRQAFIGFGLLEEQQGPFDINEDMVCFTKEGRAKVWSNSNLSKGFPQPRFDGTSASEAGMIRRIIDLLDSNTYKQGNPYQIGDYLRQRGVRTFQEANKAVEQFAQVHRITIPTVMTSIIGAQQTLRPAVSSSNVTRPIHETTKAIQVRDHPLISPTIPVPTGIQIPTRRTNMVSPQSKPTSNLQANQRDVYANHPKMEVGIIPVQSISHRQKPSFGHSNVVRIQEDRSKYEASQSKVRTQHGPLASSQSFVNVVKLEPLRKNLQSRLHFDKRCTSKLGSRRPAQYKTATPTQLNAPLYFKSDSSTPFQRQAQSCLKVIGKQPVHTNIAQMCQSTIRQPPPLRMAVSPSNKISFRTQHGNNPAMSPSNRRPSQNLAMKGMTMGRQIPPRQQTPTVQPIIQTKRQFIQQRQKLTEVYKEDSGNGQTLTKQPQAGNSSRQQKISMVRGPAPVVSNVGRELRFQQPQRTVSAQLRGQNNNYLQQTHLVQALHTVQQSPQARQELSNGDISSNFDRPQQYLSTNSKIVPLSFNMHPNGSSTTHAFKSASNTQTLRNPYLVDADIHREVPSVPMVPNVNWHSNQPPPMTQIRETPDCKRQLTQLKGYQIEIDSQLMGDIQRMRMNTLTSKAPPN